MKIVIISGGQIEDAFALEWLETHRYDSILAADSGMDFLYRNQIVPDVIAGDFDSVAKESLAAFSDKKEIEVIRLNPMKDDTDTEFVIREAIRRGAKEITVLGATGSRLDHVLANVYLLGIGLEEGVSIQLIDAHNRIRMINSVLEIKKEEQFGNFLSVLPIKGDAKGVTLEGMKYPLYEADLSCFSSLGISNEIIGDIAKISVKEGILLVIESKD